MADILDGRSYSTQLLTDLAKHINLHCKQGPPPGLAVIQVGGCLASSLYVNNKTKACELVGIQAYRHHLPADTTEQELLALISSLNKADEVHGILVQLPLPEGINSQSILEAIAPIKDVDGFHPYNIG